MTARKATKSRTSKPRASSRSKSSRGPLIQVTIQRRARRRRRWAGLFRGLRDLVKALATGEPAKTRWVGDATPPAGKASSGRAKSSRTSGGRGAPIRTGPPMDGRSPFADVDERVDARPAWQRHGLPSPEQFDEQCAAWDAERAAEGYDAEAMAGEFGDEQGDMDPSSAAGGAA